MFIEGASDQLHVWQSVWLVSRVPFNILLVLRWESEIPCAVRFDIALTQAVERQPSQGEFFREHSEHRFPIRLSSSLILHDRATDDSLGFSRCHRAGSGMFLMPPRAAMRRREYRVFRAEKRLIEIAPRHPTVDFLLCRLPAAARGPNPEKTEFRTPNSELRTPNPKPQTLQATIDHRCRDRMAIAGRSPGAGGRLRKAFGVV
jgi:hypothetical protein